MKNKWAAVYQRKGTGSNWTLMAVGRVIAVSGEWVKLSNSRWDEELDHRINWEEWIPMSAPLLKVKIVADENSDRADRRAIAQYLRAINGPKNQPRHDEAEPVVSVSQEGS